LEGNTYQRAKAITLADQKQTRAAIHVAGFWLEGVEVLHEI
jgi:hypothetical protein